MWLYIQLISICTIHVLATSIVISSKCKVLTVLVCLILVTMNEKWEKFKWLIIDTEFGLWCKHYTVNNYHRVVVRTLFSNCIPQNGIDIPTKKDLFSKLWLHIHVQLVNMSRVLHSIKAGGHNFKLHWSLKGLFFRLSFVIV